MVFKCERVFHAVFHPKMTNHFRFKRKKSKQKKWKKEESQKRRKLCEESQKRRKSCEESQKRRKPREKNQRGRKTRATEGKKTGVCKHQQFCPQKYKFNFSAKSTSSKTPVPSFSKIFNINLGLTCSTYLYL